MNKLTTSLESTIITLESDIKISENPKNITDISDLLIPYCQLYSTLSRTLFNQIRNSENPNEIYNQLQKEYIEKYLIHARLFKSIWKYEKGREQSIKSNQKNYKTQRKYKIKDTQDKIKRLEKRIKKKIKVRNIKKVKQKQKKQKKQKKYNDKEYLVLLKSKLNKLKTIDKQEQKVQSVWGSKSLFKKQWTSLSNNKEEWKRRWEIRRNNMISIIGSSDESFGNSLCQLRSLQSLRLTLPKNFSQKYLELEVDFDKDKKQYQYLKNAISLGKALTFKIFQRINGKWYVQVSFMLDSECTNYNRTIGVDINYNLISTTIIKDDGNPEKFQDYKFDSNERNKNINRQTLSDIANKIVDEAVTNQTTITIEKINLKNIRKNKKISLVCYSTFISLLKSRSVKKGILVIEINPAYTSVIGKRKYSKRLGRSVHSSASYVIGRRGLKHIDRIPKKYIYLLHSEDQSKSLLTKWGIVNKRLQKVPNKESSIVLKELRCLEDQSTCNLNLNSFRLS